MLASKISVDKPLPATDLPLQIILLTASPKASSPPVTARIDQFSSLLETPTILSMALNAALTGPSPLATCSISSPVSFIKRTTAVAEIVVPQLMIKLPKR